MKQFGEGLPIVALVMGSDSDWESTAQHAAAILMKFGIVFEFGVMSAHRMPEDMAEYAKQAVERGLKVIIAVAGGSAHLPGMVAAYTTLPVIGVPVETSTLAGEHTVSSILYMPAGTPVATMSIGKGGAVNGALFAIQILATHDPQLAAALAEYKKEKRQAAITSEANLVLPPPAK